MEFEAGRDLSRFCSHKHDPPSGGTGVEGRSRSLIGALDNAQKWSTTISYVADQENKRFWCPAILLRHLT